jgi:carbon-monoxide dehydrogenase iron sulfur subunit
MRIKVDSAKCTGCRLCLQICAIENYRDINPRKAALRIEAKFPDPGRFQPYVCTQCGKCAEVCPEEAIHRSDNGAYLVDPARCNNCGVCLEACPVRVIFQHPDLGQVIICTFCMKCTELCNTGAIVKWERPAKPAKAAAAREAGK